MAGTWPRPRSVAAAQPQAGGHTSKRSCRRGATATSLRAFQPPHHVHAPRQSPVQSSARPYRPSTSRQRRNSALLLSCCVLLETLPMCQAMYVSREHVRRTNGSPFAAGQSQGPPMYVRNGFNSMGMDVGVRLTFICKGEHRRTRRLGSNQVNYRGPLFPSPRLPPRKSVCFFVVNAQCQTRTTLC